MATEAYNFFTGFEWAIPSAFADALGRVSFLVVTCCIAVRLLIGSGTKSFMKWPEDCMPLRY